MVRGKNGRMMLSQLSSLKNNNFKIYEDGNKMQHII